MPRQVEGVFYHASIVVCIRGTHTYTINLAHSVVCNNDAVKFSMKFIYIVVDVGVLCRLD